MFVFFTEHRQLQCEQNAPKCEEILNKVFQRIRQALMALATANTNKIQTWRLIKINTSHSNINNYCFDIGFYSVQCVQLFGLIGWLLDRLIDWFVYLLIDWRARILFVRSIYGYCKPSSYMQYAIWLRKGAFLYKKMAIVCTFLISKRKRKAKRFQPKVSKRKRRMILKSKSLTKARVKAKWFVEIKYYWMPVEQQE